MFANDHTANVRFQPTAIAEETAIQELRDCAIVINDWMNNNKLKMNTSKTEFIMFGSRPQLNKCNTQEIEICSDKIELRNCIRYLGAFLDATLNFK